MPRLLSEDSQAGATLLGDEHHTMLSPDGKPVVGWQASQEGEGNLVNRTGWAQLRLVVYKKVKAALRALYDQIMIVENLGVYVVCRMRKPGEPDRFVLTAQFRMVADRVIINANSTYVAQMEDGSLWHDLVSRLGRWSWEVPAGLVKAGDGVDVKDAILQAAGQKALAEAGCVVQEMRIVGYVNANPVFFPHPQPVVLAEVGELGRPAPEAREINDGQGFYTEDELRRLVQSGVIFDARTIAALAMCGVKLG